MLRILSLAFIVIASVAHAAADRLALVVGMSAYETIVPLENTLNDARGLSRTLQEIGFDVTTLLDATGEEFRDALETFAFEAETADLVLVYFAGHGVEVQGENFLIPIDARVASNRDIQRQGVSLKQLLETVDGARKMRIVILDSCRDNPFGDLIDFAELAPESTNQGMNDENRGLRPVGLAPAKPDRGTMVAYAARDGQKALDGAGNNSPYALALMNALTQQDLEISLMFRQVRDEVLATTGNLQEPHTYGSLPGTPFYLAGEGDGEGSGLNVTDRRVAWSSLLPDQEEQLAQLAQQGDTRSLVGLAYMRLNTADQRYSPEEAAALLEQAAELGSAEAQFELARLYEKGLGVPQDYDRALGLYRASALQNFPDAINDLGFVYHQGGLGVTRDPKLALWHFQVAADLGQPQAMFNYAALIDDGAIEGKGPEESAYYLYRSLRAGSETVFDLLTDRPTMFKVETRMELQKRLRDVGFYDSAIDGQFGPGTLRAIRAAYGLS